MVVRRHFYFSGRVQGVGFRFQACRIARSLGLTGRVENLWDGRVELEAQGEERKVDELLAVLNRQPYIRIDHVETEELALVEKETSFHW